MKTKIFTFAFAITFIIYGNIFPQVLQRVFLNNNNISAYFQNTGIFNRNTSSTNAPGFEWPKGSNKFAFFTAGLCIACGINGQFAQSMASYKGEYAPGYYLNGNYITNVSFKYYSIKRGDNSQNNPDYANWYLMIPHGAPYIDVNNNHQYDPGIDSIGIRNAAQVIFLCMTDGELTQHSIGEGFGGGITVPLLKAQVAWTSWCYDRNDLMDMQFMKWSVINKNILNWDSTFFSIVGDPDLGDPLDDYIGCDTTKKLGYCYNADNNDAVYGVNPPAVGMIFHKSPLGLTSFNFFTDASFSPPPCEGSPGEPVPAYNMMQGMKTDRTQYIDVSVTPRKKTKFVYAGDPETNTGWTEYKGSMQNCNGDSTGVVLTVNPSGDRRYILSSGAVNHIVHPNDTVTIVASQLIARGTSNVNSVTKLKLLANTAWLVYNGGFNVGVLPISSEVPASYSLSQNYPNPFNPSTSIRYELPRAGVVRLAVYDVMGREVETLVNERQAAGSYEAVWDGTRFASGVYFYRLTAEGYGETRKMLLIR